MGSLQWVGSWPPKTGKSNRPKLYRLSDWRKRGVWIKRRISTISRGNRSGQFLATVVKNWPLLLLSDSQCYGVEGEKMINPFSKTSQQRFNPSNSLSGSSSTTSPARQGMRFSHAVSPNQTVRAKIPPALNNAYAQHREIAGRRSSGSGRTFAPRSCGRP